MAPTIAAVLGKARAFVEALANMPRSAHGSNPHGHFARDYNTLRQLALEAVPDIDERLLGKFVHVVETPNGELSRASYVEIEVYARQIMEQLVLMDRVRHQKTPTAIAFSVPKAEPQKTYEVQAIRQEYSQAYAAWTAQDDEYRARFTEGASISDLAEEFGRKPGGIKSRLSKLGLDSLGTKEVDRH
jgi:hypothetical protein